MSPAKRLPRDPEREPELARDPSAVAGTAAPRDDLVEVPAAVVCAFCGDPDCPGCAEERSRSGVISIVAWERPGPALGRVWATARAATHNAEAFFESLPDGPMLPAFRFALLAELLAASSMLAALGLTFVAALLAVGVHLDLSSLGLALRVSLVAVAGLTTLLVAAHAAHGWAMDRGAPQDRRSPRRALRFGLYAAGWDLVLGPIGFFVLLFKEGPARAFGLLGLSVGLPTRSSRAFLKGCYHLVGEEARPALRASYAAAAVATLVCAVAVVASVVIAVLW